MRFDSSAPVDEWLAEVKGQYVVQVLPPCDGIPRYSGGGMGYTGHESFRAEFLKDCINIIGEDLLDEAFLHKLPPDLVDYGKRLGRAAVAFAKTHGLDPKTADSEEPNSDEFRLNVVVAAAKWCVFWGSRGHYLEPDY